MNNLAKFAMVALAWISVASANDLTEFAAFQRCFGPEPDATCRMTFDCNENGEIDPDDYAVFYALGMPRAIPWLVAMGIAVMEFLDGSYADQPEGYYTFLIGFLI